MKKTIALLLAAAGMAMGATKVDLTGKWTDNVADISNVTFSGGEASFILTLNSDALRAWMGNETKVNTPIGYLSGTNTQNKLTQAGASLYDTSSQDGITAWRYNEMYKDNSTGGNSYQGKVISLNDLVTGGIDFTYAVYVCNINTSSNYSKVVSNLYFLDNELDIIGDYYTSGSATLGSTFMKDMAYNSFTINPTYVNSDYVALYNGLLVGEEDVSTDQEVQLAAIKEMLPKGSGDSVPEPATATLSLLALAGLAARRRRR
ncbi:MAG: PEP-CTERM sorting domain-containing protein [Akkermansia sp.]|nr:PEP-CTERM sorting domain-containing protein [Akkermansia sp.]